MSSSNGLPDWIQALKGEVERASDQGIRALYDNPRIEWSKERLIAREEKQPLPRTRSAILAAISDTFTFSDIQGKDSDENERLILAHADTVMIAGRRRLRLSSSSRAELLNAVLASALYDDVLRQALDGDERDFNAISNDEIRRNSAWLRAFLIGRFAPLDRAPLPELRSAQCARERLMDVSLKSSVPALDEVRRMVALAEVLEPLRILVGSSGGWDGTTPLTDRFVGREDELSTLRSFVAELDAKGGVETVQRAVSYVLNAVSYVAAGRVPGVLVIAARGGLGKSSLIAKFMLDHAVARKSRRFPFAYLDFDRAALQPREPRQLLLEVMRQVALQFPKISAQLDSLTVMLRAELEHAALTTSPQPMLAPIDVFSAFRQILQTSVTQGKYAFLLVLDTMEMVQSDPRALRGVVNFVNLLCTSTFPEARVVLAGRADVPELRQPTRSRFGGTLMPLGPLSVDEARDMANSLGTALLGKEWQGKWARRIAGSTNQPNSRREPLSIRVAVEVVRGASAEDRDKLTKEIEATGESASKSFVGALYQRRVLEHIRDEEVRKLAWPGLVLRRVTLEIVREVLAEPCNLDPAKIPATFKALEREGWIVIRDGDGFRHQPDLRARTLPLMRCHDQKKFDAVNAAAIRFFHARKDVDPRSRAEWIYHRLLAGETPESIAEVWSHDLAPYLVGADADFAPGSAPANYLFAHTSVRLEGRSAAGLNPDLMLIHITNAAPYCGIFDDERINPMLADLALEQVRQRHLNLSSSLALATLAVKTGRWGLLDELPILHAGDPTWSAHAEFALHFLMARRLSCELNPWFLEVLGDPVDNGNYPALVQRLMLKKLLRVGNVESDEQTILDGMEGGAWQVGAHDLATLRLAMICSSRLTRAAGRWWLRFADTNSFSADEIRTLSDKELEEQISLIDGAIWQVIYPHETRAKAVVTEETICRLLRSRLRQCLLVEESRQTSGELQKLRRFAAARDSDWLIPLAYASHRATSGEIPAFCLERLASYDAHRSGILYSVRLGPLKPTDVLEVLAIADRASDLVSMATLFGSEYVGAVAARDVNRLLRLHVEWNRSMERLLGDEGDLARA